MAVRASWLLVVTGLVGLLVQAVKWSRTHFVVTNHRVIYREGVVARIGVEIPISRVNNVNFHQSFIERLVGAGERERPRPVARAVGSKWCPLCRERQSPRH